MWVSYGYGLEVEWLGLANKLKGNKERKESQIPSRFLSEQQERCNYHGALEGLVSEAE